MRKFIFSMLIVLFALPAHAVPDAAVSQVMSSEMCNNIKTQLQSAYADSQRISWLRKETKPNEPKRIHRTLFDMEWYSNSQGKMVAFNCQNVLHVEQFRIWYEGTVYVIDLPALDAEIIKIAFARAKREEEFKRKITETNLL